MRLETSGLHHVTAIARVARANATFYVGVLGLRLLKRTVNFDDPSTYHLYYGDATGCPGSIVSFFVRPEAERGRSGNGQVVAVRFAVPDGSLDYWTDRLVRQQVSFTRAADDFEEEIVTLADPDGLRIQLVASGGDETTGVQTDGAVPGDCAIRGLHGIELSVRDHEPTCALLMNGLGYAPSTSRLARRRFVARGHGAALTVDVVSDSRAAGAAIGAGSVHHVAFRARDAQEQVEWQRFLRAAGLDVTDVKDRTYFRSIYFEEPGGVRFEIATDGPGFAVDERPTELGQRLKLPIRLEGRREALEAGLGSLPA